MKKVLLACHQFFPRYYTGTEVLVLEVADELVRRGYMVEILTTEPILPEDDVPENPYISNGFYNGIKIWRLYIPPTHDPLTRLSIECYDKSLMGLFEEVLDTFNPDIVHVFHLMRLTASFIDLLEKKGIPTYFTATDYWLVCPTYQLIRTDHSLCDGPEPAKCFSCLTTLYVKGMDKIPLKFQVATKYPKIAAFGNSNVALSQGLLNRRIQIHQRMAKRFDGVFITNKFMQNLLHKNGIAAKREFIQEFPVPNRSEKVREISPVSDQGPLKIAFIGTLRSSKGPQILLEACNRIKELKNIEVQVWGAAEDPNFEVELRQLVSGINWVKFCGTFAQEKFPNVLGDVHAVVIPSIWYENTPLTALTALAGKRLLIASNLGGLSSMITNGENGYLFPPGDAKALASILKMLTNDRKQVIKLAAASPSPLSVPTYVDKLLDAYKCASEDESRLLFKKG